MNVIMSMIMGAIIFSMAVMVVMPKIMLIPIMKQWLGSGLLLMLELLFSRGLQPRLHNLDAQLIIRPFCVALPEICRTQS